VREPKCLNKAVAFISLAIVGLACLCFLNVSAQTSPQVNRRRASQTRKSRLRALQSRKTFWQIWKTQGFNGGNAKLESIKLDTPIPPTGQMIMIDEVSGRCIAPVSQKVYFKIDVWSNALFHREYYFSTQSQGAGFEDASSEPLLLLQHLTSIPIYSGDNVSITAYRNSGAALVPKCQLVVSGYYALVS
jgi:hypothetical protein